MKERIVKGKPVIYVEVGETFTAEDGQKYKAMQDVVGHYGCRYCHFGGMSSGLCGRYRCIGSDRADGVGVHFVRIEEGEQS